MKSYYTYWGKADQINKQWHPLICHMLDTSAVAWKIVECMPSFSQKWQTQLGMKKTEFRDFLCFLCAIHDIGKLSLEFQNKIPELANILENKSDHIIAGYPHTSLAWIIWNNTVESNLLSHLHITGIQVIRLSSSLQPVLSAAFGHHGGPVQGPNTAAKLFDKRAEDAAIHITLDLLSIFPGMNEVISHPENLVAHRNDLQVFSFTLSGLLIFCDWTASSQENFPLQVVGNGTSFSKQIGIDDINSYFLKSLSLAKEAIERQGVYPAARRKVKAPWKELFPDFCKARYQPSPLQEAIICLEVQHTPSLYIIEDLTGSGKTEAALLLAQKLQQAEDADGLYFALPTMATSNGMYHRLKHVYHNLYVPGSTPSLVLAHGGSGFHQEFQKTIVPNMRHWNTRETNDVAQSSSNPIEQDSSQAACSSWIADRSKTAFLAQVGVGSIDQALLAVLYTKHNTLRMFGLSSKILIVDEVHAYDLYMQTILHNLLEFLALQGRSVILLSATLPLLMKRRLAEAYRKGLSVGHLPFPSTTQQEEQSFPLISIYSSEKSFHLPVDSEQRMHRRVQVRFFTEKDINGPVEYLAEIARTGKCGVWIRNTVQDVQDAYTALIRLVDPGNVRIFHSRYTMQDRQKIETGILNMYGSHSNSQTRQGQILVATQVVEQSLDLDFDAMISDLCPIDLLIQRAGRLHRHARSLQGNRLQAGEDKRGNPVLCIYGPNPNEQIHASWYSDFFPRGCFVYKDTGILWKTSWLLQKEKVISTPKKSRYLIESVYGESSIPIPESLRNHTNAIRKQNIHARAVADSNIFPLCEGFQQPLKAKPWPESQAPTRLTSDTATYRVCIHEGNHLVPLAKSEQHAWHMSEISYRKTNLLHDACTTALIEQTNTQLGNMERGKSLLPLIHIGGHNGCPMYRSIGCTDEGKIFLYDSVYGLRLVDTEKNL